LLAATLSRYGSGCSSSHAACMSDKEVIRD
jgi:hypothetical protein